MVPRRLSRPVILLKQIPLGGDGRNKADDESVPPVPRKRRHEPRIMVSPDEETFGGL